MSGTPCSLFAGEGLAIRALGLGGIGLMLPYLDFAQ